MRINYWKLTSVGLFPYLVLCGYTDATTASGTFLRFLFSISADTVHLPRRNLHLFTPVYTFSLLKYSLACLSFFSKLRIDPRQQARPLTSIPCTVRHDCLFSVASDEETSTFKSIYRREWPNSFSTSTSTYRVLRNFARVAKTLLGTNICIIIFCQN